MSDKTWLTLQVSLGILVVVLLVLTFFVIAVPQGDGTISVGEVTIWTKLIGFFIIFCTFFVVLAEVRKRTGNQLTLKTFFLTVLWFGIIILLLSVTSYLRN